MGYGLTLCCHSIPHLELSRLVGRCQERIPEFIWGYTQEVHTMETYHTRLKAFMFFINLVLAIVLFSAIESYRRTDLLETNKIYEVEIETLKAENAEYELLFRNLGKDVISLYQQKAEADSDQITVLE